MPKIVTQRDIVESITGLRAVAKDLRRATDSPTVKDVHPPAVPLSIQGLLMAATYIDQVADELQNLIPDEKVSVPE